MDIPLRKLAAAVAVLGAAGAVSACGSEKVVDSASNSASVNSGAQLFYQHCSGCHTLSAAAAEGSATKVRDREPTDGPNFNQRKETVSTVLFAIRHGGFSGAIMPQNVVVGQQAQDVAAFLAKYSGGSDSIAAKQGAAK